MFDRTGPLALYIGGNGLSGPILGPGTYFTGVYDQLREIDCSMATLREPLNALTKDGVQFGLDIYVRFSADCSDKSVEALLATLSPDQGNTISVQKVYDTYVRPAIGEAVRETVSPFRANDINEKREIILTDVRKRFLELIKTREDYVNIYEVNLTNLDFPDAMDVANAERAVQAILKDKAIAERERVQAEIETMVMRKELAEKEGDAEGARIDRVGAALKRNPEYLQFDLQQKMPDIYKNAGAGGNMVITAPEPSVVVSPRSSPIRRTTAPAEDRVNTFQLHPKPTPPAKPTTSG
jgi:regulator of protease activity HflC (stomatin/prohibitin superfamily)